LLIGTFFPKSVPSRAQIKLSVSPICDDIELGGISNRCVIYISNMQIVIDKPSEVLLEESLILIARSTEFNIFGSYLLGPLKS
jgi:hypothetical protein